MHQDEERLLNHRSCTAKDPHLSRIDARCSRVCLHAARGSFACGNQHSEFMRMGEVFQFVRLQDKMDSWGSFIPQPSNIWPWRIEDKGAWGRPSDCLSASVKSKRGASEVSTASVLTLNIWLVRIVEGSLVTCMVCMMCVVQTICQSQEQQEPIVPTPQ